MGSVRHTKREKSEFLQKYTECGRIDIACEMTGISRASHYRWLKDAKYKRAFEDARTDARQMLEDEAYRRAVQGVSRPVLHAGQVVEVEVEVTEGEGEAAKRVIKRRPLIETTYSDVLLIFLMKGADPARYRDNASIEHTGKDGAPLLDIASVRAYMRQAPEDGE